MLGRIIVEWIIELGVLGFVGESVVAALTGMSFVVFEGEGELVQG